MIANANFSQGPHWKESLKILKLVVTRSSTLVAPPTNVHVSTWESSIASPHPSFNDNEIFTKKELPGEFLIYSTKEIILIKIIERTISLKTTVFIEIIK
jgi:hypothetical protein